MPRGMFKKSPETKAKMRKSQLEYWRKRREEKAMAQELATNGTVTIPAPTQFLPPNVAIAQRNQLIEKLVDAKLEGFRAGAKFVLELMKLS